MLPFSWVKSQPRLTRAARERPPANCWTMTILRQASQNSFGRRFVITAALARKSTLTVSRYSALLGAKLLNPVHREKLKYGNDERPDRFPGIVLQQPNACIQQLDEARQCTQCQQR